MQALPAAAPAAAQPQASKPAIAAAPRRRLGVYITLMLAVVALAIIRMVPAVSLLECPQQQQQRKQQRKKHRKTAAAEGGLAELASPLPVIPAGASSALASPAGAADHQELTAIPPEFNFNKVVAIIAFDRYHYFEQVVEALLSAWGSNEYLVTITIDGPPSNKSVAFDRLGWQKIVAYSKQLQWLSRHGHGFRDVLINVSDHNVGLWPNKKQAVAGAMALSDYAVILEDDIVLQRDALRWFEWHVTSGLIFRRPEIATASCWASPFPIDSQYVMEGYDLLAVHTLGMLDKFYFRHWSTGWGWAIWQHTWQQVGAKWNGRDINLAAALVKLGLGETIPLVARCNNIGAIGFHKQGAETRHIHERTIASNRFPNLGRCQYTEVPNGPKSPQPQELEAYVRMGLSHNRQFVNTTLEELQDRMLQFVKQHPDPARFHSTC